MENPLSKYYNNEPLASKVCKACRVCQLTSKDGKTYYMIEFELLKVQKH